MNELRGFLHALWNHYKLLVTGSLLAVVFAIFSAFGTQLPIFVSLTCFLGTMFIACFLSWRDEFRARENADRRLRPKLAIPSGVPQPVDDHFRIWVRNISGGQTVLAAFALRA